MGYFVYGKNPAENFFLFVNPEKTGTNDHYLYMDNEDVSFRNVAFLKNIGLYYDTVEIPEKDIQNMLLVARARYARQNLFADYARYFRGNKSKL